MQTTFNEQTKVVLLSGISQLALQKLMPKKLQNATLLESKL